jgi:hypothetical protein
MSTETIAAIIAGSALVYTVMIGVGWQLGGAHWSDPGPFFVGVLWPLILPAMLGVSIVRRITARTARLPKAQALR